jgi:hypothetical protein
MGIPPDEFVYSICGINFVDFFLRLEHQGEDIYALRLVARDEVPSSGPDRWSRTSTCELW